jgi:outer membrane protein
VKLRIIFLSCIFLLPVFNLQAQPLPSEESLQKIYSINLQTAINLALKHSYELKAAQSRTNVASDNKTAALRAFAPTITASASHSWQNSANESNIFHSNEKNLTSQGGLTLTQPIFGVVTLFHSKTQKDISLEIAKYLEKSSQNQAALFGAQYYLNVQLAMAQLETANASLTTLQKSKQDADSSFQTGSIYKDDYLRILLQYTQASQAVSTAQSSLNVALFALAQSLGIANPDNMKVAFQPLSYWESNNFKLPNLEDAKKIALEQNSDILAAQENIKLAQINKTISEDNYLPTLNAFVDYEKNFNSIDVQNNKKTDAVVDYGLKLTWNIWDWGVRAAQNSALTDEISNQKYLSEQEKETILNNVVSQYYKILDNISALKTAKASVATSDEAFNLVSFRFLNGQVSALELITAQQNLATSKSALAQARFNLDLAWLTFQTVLGKNPTL